MLLKKVAISFILLNWSITSLAISIEEFRLWEIQDQDFNSKGYLFGVIDVLPLAANKDDAKKILFKYIPELENALSNSDLIIVENPFALGMQPDASLDELVLGCNPGLGKYLSQEELDLARKKLLSLYGPESIYYRYAYCLNPMYAVFSEKIQLTGGTLAINRETIIDVILNYAEDNMTFVSYLEENEGEASYLSLPDTIQCASTLRWLHRNESLVLSEMDTQEYDYYRKLILDCYFKSESCFPLEAEKVFLNAYFAPGTYLDDGVNNSVKNEITKTIIEHRNNCWLPDILYFLTQTGKKTLFAIGLNHLNGNNGLVSLLAYPDID